MFLRAITAITLLLTLTHCFAPEPASAGIVSDCAKIFTPHPSGTRVWLPSHDILKMFRHFSISEGIRTAEDHKMTLKYKNEEPNTNPVLLDLDELSLFNDSPALIRVTNFYHKLWLQNAFDNRQFLLKSQYAHKVMLLRKGDSIRHGKKQILLGEYLGAGNATHIFRHGENPEHVVRIPFYALGDAITQGRSMMKKYLKLYKELPQEVPHIEIHEIGPDFSYVIADYVNGTLTGRDLLNDYTPVSSEYDRQRFERLDYLTLFFDTSVHRQFIWDEEVKDWILVDWE